MNTRKLILAVAFAVNVAIIVAVSAMSIHQHGVHQTNTIELGAIVVTPADAIPETVNLGAIVVTPTDADWEYAEAHGVQRPVAKTTSVFDAGMDEDAAASSLMQALNALSPGQYLDTDAAMRALNTLAFAGQGG
ncbi:MAG: hypothetical protein ACRER0_00710 [Gammaproteobacteria bacterium]